MDETKNEFNEIEYFTDVAKIRYLIANLEKKHGLVDHVLVDNGYGKANPVYNRINPTGAFGLSFLNGYPDAIFTPFGEVKIDSAKHNSNNQIDKAYLMGDLRKVLGLVEVEASLEKYGIAKGARYAITKLPWKANQKLPDKYQRPNGFVSVMYQVDMLRHLDSIYKEVNENFLKAGHPELMILDAQKKHKLAINHMAKTEVALVTTVKGI